jgi:hypothetical protein
VQTDRAIPNNKLDNMIRDSEKGTCLLIDVSISGDRNVIKQDTEKSLKYKHLKVEIRRMWNVKNKSNTSNNRGNWNRLKIIQTVPEHNTWKARNQGTTKKSTLGTAHIGLLRRVQM